MALELGGPFSRHMSVRNFHPTPNNSPSSIIDQQRKYKRSSRHHKYKSIQLDNYFSITGIKFLKVYKGRKGTNLLGL